LIKFVAIVKFKLELEFKFFYLGNIQLILSHLIYGNFSDPFDNLSKLTLIMM
jgi:hypothetical protein